MMEMSIGDDSAVLLADVWRVPTWGKCVPSGWLLRHPLETGNELVRGDAVDC